MKIRTTAYLPTRASTDVIIQGVSDRLRRGSVLAVGVLVVLALSFSVISRLVWHQSPWQRLPDRVSACGRDFSHPATSGVGAFTQSSVTAQRASRTRMWWTLHGQMQVWATQPCGMQVFVRTPDGRFTRFELVGGP